MTKPKNPPELTAERLRALLSYDPETGLFRWRVNVSRQKAGAIAGRKSKGYIRIKIDRHTYSAHRLAWLHFYGVWPTEQLDHLNVVRDDNRIANLREATNAENGQNCVVSRNNSSGHPGVHWDKRCRKWRARIKVNRKEIYLGVFENIDDAAAARAKAKSELHTFHPYDRTGADHGR